MGDFLQDLNSATNKISMNKLKKTNGLDNFIYGSHAVKSVLINQKARAKKLLIARKQDSDQFIALAKDAAVPYEMVSRDVLESKFDVGSDSQGLVLLCAPFEYSDLDQFL